MKVLNKYFNKNKAKVKISAQLISYRSSKIDKTSKSEFLYF